jgi:hypothetical protein
MKKLFAVMLLTFVALSTSVGQTQVPEKKVEKAQPSGGKVSSTNNAEQEVSQLADQYIAALKGY